MKKLTMALALAGVLAGTGLAYAATIVDEDFTKLNTDIWRVYSNSEGMAEVKDGALIISNVDTGWKQKGIVLRSPVDLSAGATTVEIVYKENKFSQQCPAFVSVGDIEGEDNWNSPGFRITVGLENSNWEALSGFAGVNGSIEKGDPFDTVSPFTLKWTLKKKDGTIYDTTAFVNGEQKGTATMDMGEFPTNKAFFYFYVSNNADEGPTVVDSIRITQ